jgi:hypothetical protein
VKNDGYHREGLVGCGPNAWNWLVSFYSRFGRSFRLGPCSNRIIRSNLDFLLFQTEFSTYIFCFGLFGLDLGYFGSVHWFSVVGVARFLYFIYF